MCIDNDNYDDGDKATYERALAIAVATTKTSTTALIIIPTTAHTHTQQPHHECPYNGNTLYENIE